MTPCGVMRRPRRALPLVFSTWNEIDILWDCSNAVEGRTPRPPRGAKRRAGACSAVGVVIQRARRKYVASPITPHCALTRADPGRGRPGLHILVKHPA